MSMLKALLLTRDQQVVGVVRGVLESASAELDPFGSTREARAILAQRKFDAIFIDCDDVQDGSALIQEVRRGKSNSKSIIFAIVNKVTSVQAAFEIGANFVLEKPVSAERAARSLRASQGLILRERRRFYRHDVQGTAYLTFAQMREAAFPLTNVSEGGIGLATRRIPEMNGPVQMRFTLPGTSHRFEARGEFILGHDAGIVGIRFLTIPPASKSELDRWLSQRLPSVAPSMVPAGAR